MSWNKYDLVSTERMMFWGLIHKRKKLKDGLKACVDFMRTISPSPANLSAILVS